LRARARCDALWTTRCLPMSCGSPSVERCSGSLRFGPRATRDV